MLLVPLSLVQAALMFLPEERVPGTALRAGYSSAIHAVNRYGLFAVMTRGVQRSCSKAASMA